MELLLKIINKPQESNYSESFQFSTQGGTIGRDSNCSWILADAARVIEDIHIEIIYANGSFFLQDISKYGLTYTKTNAKVPSHELVRLCEGDQLTVGPYDILVHFIKDRIANRVIDDFLNQREIDVAMNDNTLLRKDHDSPVNIILKEKPLDKDILSYVDIIPEEEDPFGDIEKQDTVLSEHISVPTLEEPQPVETPIEPKAALSDRQSDFLMTIFFDKLGLDRSKLDSTREAYIISELAETILSAIEGIDAIHDNINKITQEFQSTKSTPKPVKKSLQKFYDRDKPYRLSKELSAAYQDAIHHHTALYRSLLEVEKELTDEISPHQVYEQQQSRIPLRTNAKVARYYQERYAYLDQHDTKQRLITSRLKDRYKACMDTFLLAKKREN